MLSAVRKHPALPEESRCLIDQYLLNLNCNSKGESMAQENKKVCEDLYSRYQNVFDLIYLTVRKEPPRGDGNGTRLHRFAVSLSDLVEKGLIGVDAVLTTDYGEGDHSAKLVGAADDIQIQLDGEAEKRYPSLGKAASTITGKPTDGWTFWKTKERSGAGKPRYSARQVRARIDVFARIILKPRQPMPSDSDELHLILSLIEPLIELQDIYLSFVEVLGFYNVPIKLRPEAGILATIREALAGTDASTLDLAYSAQYDSFFKTLNKLLDLEIPFDSFDGDVSVNSSTGTSTSVSPNAKRNAAGRLVSCSG